MREIKFRAKATFDDQWVYGYYVQRDGYEKGMIYEPGGLGHDVKRKTVGEYTGLKDKNGVEIYEGDIVKRKHNQFGDYFPKIKIVSWTTSLAHNGFNLASSKNCEVIGNIYENPELLEGKTL